jgi:mono/diheme cytochrome c family protein
MRTLAKIIILAVVVTVALGIVGLAYVKRTGLRAQPRPGPLETRLARTVRAFAIPEAARARVNPLAASEEAFWLGLEHFARYCAMCHANDGSGENTPIGQGLFPKPPDMRTEPTQRLTDGELFYIIENGVRFTGMPAFGTGAGDPAGDAQVWQLVRFIRRLPRITADEVGRMEALNPL